MTPLFVIYLSKFGQSKVVLLKIAYIMINILKVMKENIGLTSSERTSIFDLTQWYH